MDVAAQSPFDQDKLGFASLASPDHPPGTPPEPSYCLRQDPEVIQRRVLLPSASLRPVFRSPRCSTLPARAAWSQLLSSTGSVAPGSVSGSAAIAAPSTHRSRAARDSSRET